MEGARYEGEILRFRLQAAPADGDAGEQEEWQVELRVGRDLLATPAWDRLDARDVARCGEHFLRERLQREGLPSSTHPRFTLDEHTDTGAYRGGPPWGTDSPPPGVPFEAPGPPHARAAGA